MIKKDREYRDMTLRIAGQEPDDRMTVRGYATTFSEPYELYRDDDIVIMEQVAPEAFAETDMTDVILQYNHEGRVFARTKNGTLRLASDDKGLGVEADLGGTEIGRGLFEEIKGGYTDKMSFGFTVSSDKWEEVNEGGMTTTTRTITGIGKLYDVSAVSIPANDATSLSVRELSDGVIARVKAERLEAQTKKKEARHKKIEAINDLLEELKK